MDITLDGITLPEDLQWIDEFDWSPVAQDREYTIGGALSVQEGTKLAGRAITLSGGDWAWVPRTTVNALHAIKTAGREMSLTLGDGRQFTVMWDFASNPLKATPVIFQSPMEDADQYYLELRLFEV